jgi:hypothetical protein
MKNSDLAISVHAFVQIRVTWVTLGVRNLTLTANVSYLKQIKTNTAPARHALFANFALPGSTWINLDVVSRAALSKTN